MSVLQYVVSADNLGENGVGGDGILVGSLEEAKSYLDRCVNGDGKIEEEIGLDMKQINSFDNISEAEAIIEDTKNQFVERKQYVTYKIYKNLMESRSLLKSSEFFLIPIDQDFNAEDKSKFLSFGWTLKRMNDYIKTKASDANKQESWEITGYDESKTCGTGINDASYSGKIVFSPLKCKPIDRNWIPGSDVNIKGRAEIISETIKKIDSLKSNYLTKLEGLRVSYESYLTTYITALEFFNNKIKSITNSIREYIGDGSNLFGFVKCNFIGTNLKIMLKYLKTALGKNIKTVGICLTIVGCSLALSISSTILLIVIINISLEKQTAQPEPPQTVQGPIPEYNNGNYGQDPNINIIQYQS